MSNFNIKRAVDNIRSKTNIYTPVTEVVVNAIQAIEELGSSDGVVKIHANRIGQADCDESIPGISGFTITDNGIGFNDEHRESFDTLYTEKKIAEGGKGFGRFTCLKYYKDVEYQSIYKQDNGFYERSFSMGNDKEIIDGEVHNAVESSTTGTIVRLKSTIKTFPEKSLTHIARRLVEQLLPYFISEKTCPKIILAEDDGSRDILLNSYIGSGNEALIIEAPNPKAKGQFQFDCEEKTYIFSVRTFKIYSPSRSP